MRKRLKEEKVNNLDKDPEIVRKEIDSAGLEQISLAPELTRANEALNDILMDRARMEKILRETEDRFEAFINNSPAVAFLKDEDGRIMWINKSCERSFKVKLQDWQGKTDFEIWPAAVAREIRKNDLLIFMNNEPTEFIETVPGSGGDRTWLSIKFPFRDASGRRFLGGVAIEITERVQGEEYAQRLAAIVESSNDAIIGKSLDGIITTWNRGAERIYGYSAEEIIGRPVSLLVPADRPDEVPGILKRLQRGEMIDQFETVRVRKDGSLIDIAVTISPVRDTAGRIIGASSVARDITDRLKTEEDLRKAHEGLETLSHRLLEVQEMERRHIARELHDEIGQALTAIKINMQAMQRDIVGETQLSRINDSLQIVDHAIQQVRNLSLDLRPSILDDLGIVAALRWYLDRISTRAGFQTHFDASGIDTRLGTDIETTCFRIVQEALTNIVRHARAQNVEVRIQKNGADLYLTIRDDGIGFNVDEAKEKAIHGGSLGVLGMQERSSLAGGSLEIQSALNQGTEIRVKIPCRIM